MSCSVKISSIFIKRKIEHLKDMKRIGLMRPANYRIGLQNYRNTRNIQLLLYHVFDKQDIIFQSQVLNIFFIGRGIVENISNWPFYMITPPKYCQKTESFDLFCHHGLLTHMDKQPSNTVQNSTNEFIRFADYRMVCHRLQ